MNISSVGGSSQYMETAASGPSSAAVAGKLIDQEKADGQAAVEMIQSAGSEGSKGQTLSVYA